MATDIYERPIAIMKWCLRKNVDHQNRPLLIFSCGGEEPSHPSRAQLRDYIRAKKIPGVICLKAEDVAKRKEFAGVDLVTQEAMIADASDWLLIFAESVGSFCELGAFTALPHIRAITSVVEDQSHARDNSYINNGPIRMVEEESTPLARKFIAPLEDIVSCGELTSFVYDIRNRINDGENNPKCKGRMALNKEGSNTLSVGPLVHEWLDLVSLLGPIGKDDLLRVYRALREIPSGKIHILSRSVSMDMAEDNAKITPEQVLGFMAANGLIEELEPSSGKLPTTYVTHLVLKDYFMFKNSIVAKQELLRMKAQLLSAKRHMRMEGARHVYRRAD